MLATFAQRIASVRYEAALDRGGRFLFRVPRLPGAWARNPGSILFALSLDLILGYAGIVTLGHARSSVGAYTAGVLARNGWGEPLERLAVAARPWPRCSASPPAR